MICLLLLLLFTISVNQHKCTPTFFKNKELFYFIGTAYYYWLSNDG